MKKILLVILVIASINIVSYAGGNAMSSAGDKALLFQFNGLSNLGVNSYMESPSLGIGSVSIPRFQSIGVKYYITNDFAGKAAFLFGYNSETEKSSTGGFSDRKESSFGLGLEFGLQKNVVKSGAFLGYVGATANFAFLTGTLEPSVLSPPPNGTVTKYNANMTQFGIGGTLGFEYFVYDRISLGAEYQFGFVFGSGTYEITRQAQPTTTSDLPSQMSLGFNTISFKLAAYF